VLGQQAQLSETRTRVRGGPATRVAGSDRARRQLANSDLRPPLGLVHAGQPLCWPRRSSPRCGPADCRFDL